MLTAAGATSCLIGEYSGMCICNGVAQTYAGSVGPLYHLNSSTLVIPVPQLTASVFIAPVVAIFFEKVVQCVLSCLERAVIIFMTISD